MNVPRGVHLVKFADDLAVVGVAKTGQLLEDAVNQWKRRLLASVVESQLLYATPIWSAAVSASARATGGLIQPQRIIALG